MTDESLPPPPTLRATCERNLHRSVLSGVTPERQAPLSSCKELPRPSSSAVASPFYLPPGAVGPEGPSALCRAGEVRSLFCSTHAFGCSAAAVHGRLRGAAAAAPGAGRCGAAAREALEPRGRSPVAGGSAAGGLEPPRGRDSTSKAKRRTGERGKPAEEPRAKALPPAAPYSLLPSWSPAPGAQPLPGRAGTLRGRRPRGQRGRDAPQPANARRYPAAPGPFVRLRDGPLPPASLPAARPTYRLPCPAPSSRAPGAAAAAPAGWGAPGRLRAGLKGAGGGRCPGTRAGSGQRSGPARLGGQLRCGARCGALRPGSVLSQPALSEIAAVRSQAAARNLFPLRCCGRESFPGF